MALDILHDNWGPYTHTEVENALKSYLAALEQRISDAIHEGGIGLEELSQEVRTLLNKANTALQPENLASWAKQQNKPGYTVSEITYDNLTTLAQKLAAMDTAIQAAAQSGGVEPDNEMSDTSENVVQNKVIKAYVDAVSARIDTLIGSGNVQGAIDTFNEVVAFLNGINSSDTLAAKLALKANDADVVKGIKDSNGNTLSKSNGIVTLPESQGGLTKEDISVETQGDGTVEVNVGRGADKDTYTINLNHTHQHMAKLEIVDEEPSNPALDTIYAQVDNVSIPTEIQKLFIAGLEFEKGWMPDNGEAVIKSPSNGTTIDLGEIDQGSVSKTIIVRGWNLTGALSVAIVGTGLSMNYGQLTGQTSITIPQGAALTGAEVEIEYSGTDGIDDGGLVISQGNDVLSQVVVTAEASEVPLKAIKLLGEQAFITDWNLTTDTDVTMKVKFTANANSYDSSQTERWYFLSEPYGDNASYPRYYLYLKEDGSNAKFVIQIKANQSVNVTIPSTKIETDESILTMLHTGAFSFVPGGNQTAYTASSKAIPSRSTPLVIGALTNYASPTTVVPNKAMNKFYMTIYEITISENNVVKRHYLPYKVHGIPGLFDEVTGHFMSSCTGVDVVPVQLNS